MKKYAGCKIVALVLIFNLGLKVTREEVKIK